mgnify:CR=1 FL=1
MESIPLLLQTVRASPELVNLSSLSGVRIQLKYAEADNFVGKNIYGEFKEAFLHRSAATALQLAANTVTGRHPGYQLVIYDALRPHRFQSELWKIVKGTPDQDYVADPALGSIHAYGMAVDLSVLDTTGAPLDMGTPFDGFSPLSEPKHEEAHLKTGALSAQQYQNRLLLRDAMTNAGFLPIPNEWWHFNRFPSEVVRRTYRRID